MKKYKYLTEKIDYQISRKNLQKNLQKLLDERAEEGWRLVKYDFTDWLCACIVVFEKEIE